MNISNKNTILLMLHQMLQVSKWIPLRPLRLSVTLLSSSPLISTS